MKKIFLIGVAVFIIYFIVLCVTTHESYFPAPGEMFVNEYWDRSVHYLRGSWYPLHKAPYKEVFSEQLPVATYFGMNTKGRANKYVATGSCSENTSL